MKAKSYSNYDCWVLVRKVKSDKKKCQKIWKEKVTFYGFIRNQSHLQVEFAVLSFFFLNLILLFLRWYFSRFECRNQKWVSIFFFSVNEKFFFHNRKKNYGWWLRKLTTALWGSDYGQQEREIRNKLRKVGHRPSFMHCQKGKYCGGFPSVIGPL